MLEAMDDEEDRCGHEDKVVNARVFQDIGFPEDCPNTPTFRQANRSAVGIVEELTLADMSDRITQVRERIRTEDRRMARNGDQGVKRNQLGWETKE